MELERESLRLKWALRNQRVMALNVEALAGAGVALGPRLRVRLFGVADGLLNASDYSLPLAA